MQFRQTVIWKDISKILEQTTNQHPIGTWLAQIHTVDYTTDVIKVSNIDIDKDFVGSYSEEVTLTALVDRGTYQTHIYPYLDNLEVTLSRYPHRNTGDNTPVKPDFKQRFKAIFLPEANANVLGNADEMNATMGTQLLKPVFLYLQLMNLNVEPMRLKFVSTSLLGYTNEMNLSSVIKNETSKIKLPTGNVIDKMDIAPPDNKTPVQNVIVPSDTNLLDFPNYLQKHAMGVYNAGLNTFVTSVKDIKTKKYEATFFVYPTHKSVSKRPILYLYNLPNFELGYNDKTFSIKGNHIHAMGHINQGYRENKQTNELIQGTGFRVPSGSNFMSKPVKMTPAGPEGESKKLNYKAVAKSRQDGFNLAHRQKQITTCNPYEMYSNSLKQIGNYIYFQVQQFDFTFLSPSMPVVLYRLVGNVTVKQFCTLIGYKTVVQMKDKGVATKAGYSEMTILTLYITGLEKQGK